jgi:hypothetical protein
MDIGTAKPTADERARVRHHLIDLVGPDHVFTVAEFQAHFERVRVDLAARGRRAILVGGTGLYHRVVIDRLEIPGEWPDLRARLSRRGGRARTRGAPRPTGRARPGRCGADGAHQHARVVRALEVCVGSGRPFSSFGPGLDAYPDTDVIQIGLRWDRAVLAERIEARVHAMMAAGFLDEVRALAEHGHLAHGRPGARLPRAARPPRRPLLPRRGGRHDRPPDPPVRRPTTPMVPARPPRTLGGRRRRSGRRSRTRGRGRPSSHVMTPERPHQAPRARQRLPRRVRPDGRRPRSARATRLRPPPRRRRRRVCWSRTEAVDGADARMVLHNADGSRAEMSGNGIRCFAQAVARRTGSLAPQRILTDAGERSSVCRRPRTPTRSRPRSRWARSSISTSRPGWAALGAHPDRPSPTSGSATRTASSASTT